MRSNAFHQYKKYVGKKCQNGVDVDPFAADLFKKEIKYSRGDVWTGLDTTLGCLCKKATELLNVINTMMKRELRFLSSIMTCFWARSQYFLALIMSLAGEF